MKPIWRGARAVWHPSCVLANMPETSSKRSLETSVEFGAGCRTHRRRARNRHPRRRAVAFASGRARSCGPAVNLSAHLPRCSDPHPVRSRSTFLCRIRPWQPPLGDSSTSWRTIFQSSRGPGSWHMAPAAAARAPLLGSASQRIRRAPCSRSLRQASRSGTTAGRRLASSQASKE